MASTDPRCGLDLVRSNRVAAHAVLFIGFFLSGFCALVYQTVWQRMLGLFGGSDSIAATIVVGAFLLGLGTGSLLAALFVDRLSDRRAVQAFALCEIGIAGYAALSRPLFYDLLFGKLITLAQSTPQVLCAAFLALLPPTVLMGLSLPLLSKAVVRGLASAAGRISALYCVNTLGAAAGAMVAGWYAIGSFGYVVTTYFSAALSLSVGMVALAAGAWMSPMPPKRQTTHAAALSSRLWVWSGLVFASGFLIISFEIVWLRVLGTLMQGVAYAFSLVLGVFLLGDALGIAAGTRLARSTRRAQHIFWWLQGVAVLVSLGTLWAIFAGHAMAPLAWEFVEHPAALPELMPAGRIAAFIGLCGFAILPGAFVFGMTFPAAQKAVQNDETLIGHRVGLIQLSNILGNAAGAIVTGLVFLHVMGTVGTLCVLGGLGLAFAIALAVRSGWTRERWAPAHAGLCLVLIAVLLLFPSNREFWARLHGAHDEQAVVVDEDRTGIALFRLDQGYLYVGGLALSKAPFSAAHAALGVLGPLLHPHPDSVLIVGYGAGGTPYAAGVNPQTRRVRVVEIVAPIYSVMREVAAQTGSRELIALLQDSRIDRRSGDGRHILFTDRQRYDVIEADALLPQASNSGMLYSAEYFAQLRDRLADDGICIQWAPTERTVTTFRGAFPYVTQRFRALIGSKQPIMFDMDGLAARLRGPARRYLEEGGLDPETIIRWLRQDPPAKRSWGPADAAPGLDRNTDLFPKDEYFLNRSAPPVSG